MITEPQQLIGLSHLLLLINKLLLSSDETILLFIFDSDSSDIATKILCENVSLKSIVIKFDPNNPIDKGMYQENAIMLSVISQQPSITSRFFIDAFLNKNINIKSKHLCIVNNFAQQSEIESFVSDCKTLKLNWVVLQLTNKGDILFHSSLIPYYSPTINERIINNSSVVHDRLFSFKHRNISVLYIAFGLNPPFSYRVQDFKSNETYLGGIDIRIIELLAEKWNWTLRFLEYSYTAGQPATQDYHKNSKFDDRFTGRSFRTIVPKKRRHPYSYFHLQDFEKKYIILYQITATSYLKFIYSPLNETLAIYSLVDNFNFNMNEADDISSIFGIQKLVIIVPLEWKSWSITTLVKSPLFNVWTAAIITVTFLRMGLQKCIYHRQSRSLLDLFFDTFGLIFGTASGRPIDNRPERMLMLFLAFGALLAGILCTGILFEQFTTKQRTPTINSLSDLLTDENDNVERTLCLPQMAFDSIEFIFQQRFTGTIIMTEFDIMLQIHDGNFSCIYILSEQKAREIMSYNNLENKAKLFHVIPNTYLCK